MRFIRRTAGYSLVEHRRNEDILKELNTVCYIQQYRTQWKNHVERMDPERKPKQILSYAPSGRRSGETQKETITDPLASNM
jgi:hypothetical protein